MKNLVLIAASSGMSGSEAIQAWQFGIQLLAKYKQHLVPTPLKIHW